MDRYIDFNVTNPATNAYAVTGITFSVPAGWTVTGCGQYLDTSPAPEFDSCSNGPTSATFYLVASSSYFGILPGQTMELELDITPPTTSSATIAGSITSSVQDSSGSGFSPGPSISIWAVTNTITQVALTPSAAQSYVAGASPISFTATIEDASNAAVAKAGVPIFFTSDDEIGSFSGSGITCYAGDVFNCYGYTGSNGQLSATFTPDKTAGGSATVYAAGPGYVTFDDGSTYNGGAPHCDGTCPSYGSTSVTTYAAAPVKVLYEVGGHTFHSIHYTTAFATPSSGTGNYATVAASSITAVLVDRFNNTVSLADITTGPTCTFSAVNSFFDAGAGSHPTTATGTAGATCTTSALTLTYPYFQSGIYGSRGSVQATISGAYTPPGGTAINFAASGSSGNVFTSTFDTTVAPLTAPTCADCGATLTAGSSESLSYTLQTTVQQNVPVVFYAYNTTAATDYVGSFTTGNMIDSTTNPGSVFANSTVATSSAGVASVKFAIDTTLSNTAQFYVCVIQPTDAGGATHQLGCSGNTLNLQTAAGTASKLVVTTYFEQSLSTTTKKIVNDTALWVNVAMQDAYGNAAANPGPSAIQINLAVTRGSISTTVVIINSGQTQTSDVGPIKWGPITGAVGTTATITASSPSGLSNSAKTITIVSANPVINATASPPVPTLNGVVYSNSVGVTFNGTAAVSRGYPAGTVDLQTASSTLTPGIWYKIDNGAYQSATTCDQSCSWAAAVFFTSGLHTVTFKANDSSGSTSSTFTLQVLVDATPVNIDFVTAPNANISSPATLSANVVDPMGDLNASSVTAVATNIDTSATKTLTTHMTGTSNLGHSVTYGVSISGLTTGNWTVELSAGDLAGNSNSSTITVHVTVPFAQSFVVSGTPSASTVGSFAGISASYTNLNPTSQSVVVFAVFKNSAGQTVGIGTGSVTIGAGATQSVFIADPVGLASGTYTVNIFVFTTGNLPVSAQTPISVTV